MARQKPGLTLLELLLVLTLLAVIGSLATPAIFNSFSSVRLRRAADQVLAAWSAARTRAIETSQPQAFYYERETGDYWLATFDPTLTENAQGEAAAKPSVDEAGRQAYARLRQLPENLSFYVGESTAADLLSSQRRPTSDAQQTAILFFPDGAATDATLVLVNDREQVIRISLRGLTGVGRASTVLARRELTLQTQPRAR